VGNNGVKMGDKLSDSVQMWSICSMIWVASTTTPSPHDYSILKKWLNQG